MNSTAREPFLPLIRALATTFQAFELLSGHHVRQMGLTPPQFDVIATLGNTPGMSCKDLSVKTLITKGTLTGVIDRLIEKGLVERTTPENDKRSTTVSLTEAGHGLFSSAFPAHVAYMKTAFAPFSAEQINTICSDLQQLGQAFTRTMEQQLP
jgi:MarR family 2-MHQ and catechol resistance regulon transcriptional repressor